LAEEVVSGLLQRWWPQGEPPGRSGENIACEHLEGRRYVILVRNFRCRSGEVDIIARDGEVTVFVEVKERHGRSHGEGHEAVTFGKRRRLIRAARIYAATHGLSERPLRFDVISIDWPAGGEAPVIRHDAGAFDSDGL
jgi:putative endonuclease